MTSFKSYWSWSISDDKSKAHLRYHSFIGMNGLYPMYEFDREPWIVTDKELIAKLLSSNGDIDKIITEYREKRKEISRGLHP